MTGSRQGSAWRRKALVRWTVGALFLGLGFGAAVSGCAGTKARTSAAEPPEVEPPAVERTVVRNLVLSPDGDGTRIRLEAVPEPRHRLSIAEEPPAAELELFDVTFEGIPPHVEVGDGTVTSVDAQALPAGGGRVVVKLAAPGEARVVPWEGGLDLIVRRSPVEEAPAVLASSRGSIQALDGGKGVAFELGAEPANFGAFVLSDGRRLVVDAEGVTIPEPQVSKEFPTGAVARVRMGRQEGRVRTVLEAREPDAFEGYRLEKRPGGFVVLLKGAEAGLPSPAAPAERAAQPVQQAAASVQPEATVVEAVAEDYPGGGQIVDLGFRQDPDWSYVEIGFSKPASHEVSEVTDQRVVLDLVNTTLTDRFRRALDTSAFPGPVRLVAAYPKGTNTRVVVDLRRPAPFRLVRDSSTLALAFEGGSEGAGPEGVTDVRTAGDEVILVEGRPGAPTPAEMEATAAPERPTGPVYTGRKLSMDFVDADIRNVLRLIGEVSGLNLVAGDDVQGKVTVRLVDVPWDQALDVILKTRGLDQVREGNVIRIAPAERLAQEKARALEAEKAAEELAPLVTDIVPVNYASAQELSDKVGAILSERGSVSVDQRTNAILVKDVAEKVEEARHLVGRLDTQTPQVLIEARIVEVASTFSQDLGIQWGGQFVADTAHGNATDWAFPHSVDLVGATGADNFAVNFPAAVGGGSPGGALALTLGHVNDVLTLDLRLSAIESSGRGRVVSSPRVTTLDNRTAEISQGTEIPFTTATEEKIETSSIDYLLKLNVTPHVTADRSIIMRIELTKDSPSTTFFAVDSRTPAKETRTATTEVLVKDGETTVIGGIITDTQSHNQSGIPWLHKIPGLGWLFKKKADQVDKTELIIFITPKIVSTESFARSL